MFAGLITARDALRSGMFSVERCADWAQRLTYCALYAPLLLSTTDSAKAKLRAGYPFKPVETIARRYSVSESMKQFMRDGFIDR